ncbi:MAG: hypothetical protein QOD75_3161 [Blastocatellia bacterium]|jgi:hypothetical protein|nr:hypothetical protein [Blastocatellia bacterium]
MHSLTSADIAYIRSSGRDPEAVAAQIEILKSPRVSAPLIREAVVGDGIEQFQTYDLAALLALNVKAASEGRISSFVPASGSGTRLFQSLLHIYRNQETDLEEIRRKASQGNAASADALAVLENIESFAIWPELEGRGCSPHSSQEILQTLFGNEGLRYHELPKGLIPFHRYEDDVRTAFAEHIHEAGAITAGRNNNCRIHFTVSAVHRRRFEEDWLREQPALERALGVRCQVEFSVQSPATDTIAVDLDGNLRRDNAGNIIFLPGGHGALLPNLAATGGDIVLIKNIDNVASRSRAAEVIEIRKQISGLLLHIQSQVHEAIRSLRRDDDPNEALQFLHRQFGRKIPHSRTDEASRRDYASAQLNRPLRVCGVVATLEHAGGRPFWMDVEQQGPMLQIVEGAEVDLTDPEKKEQFFRSRYFNPVDIACALRDVDGNPFDLNRFTDPSRAIIAEKVLQGVPSLLYEHPGLWNGGMALWNTVFVEIPSFAFNPVKSLSDLRSPGHLA